MSARNRIFTIEDEEWHPAYTELISFFLISANFRRIISTNEHVKSFIVIQTYFGS